MTTHTAHLGHILDIDGRLLDEVVLTLFRGPNSFTGEDVIELSCHGSLWIQQQLVNRLTECGARPALAGEFTRRAFVNKRLDLAQAEAIADLLDAQGKTAHRVAMNQMKGAFTRQLADLRRQLLDLTTLVEVELDFSEEDVEFADRAQLLSLVREIDGRLSRLASSYNTGQVIRDGVPVAIVGATNAGKSTILNALVGDDKAIVSDVHGTTRDLIEDTLLVNGILIRLVDTAGLRHTDDSVETIGIDRALRQIEKANIVLWIIDATAYEADIRSTFSNMEPHIDRDRRLLAVINKRDLVDAERVDKLTSFVTSLLTMGDLDSQVVSISAHDEHDIAELKDRIAAMSGIPQVDDNTVIVVNARHYHALTAARADLARVIDALNSGLPTDLLTQDLRECLHHLGEITGGEITATEVLNNIFSRFCIGK